MNKNLLILLSFTFLQSLLFAQNDININPNSTFNGEQSLAVNPTNPNNLVVAWMKVTVFTQPIKLSIATSYSNDGGLTWSTPINIPHVRTGNTSADPTIVFSNTGTAYLGFIDYRTQKDSGAVYVCKSTNGGTSWSASSKVIDFYANSDMPIDRPWLAIDNSGGANNGKLYMAVKSLKEDVLPHHIFLCSSNNNGVTWSAPKLIDDSIPVGPTLASMGTPTVTANGTLIVNYLSYAPSINLYARYINAVSTDGGQTFHYKPMCTLPAAAATSSADSLFQYSCNLASNPANANNYILTFTDKRNGDFDIYTTATQDGGSTWSTATRINDDVLSNGIAQDMIWANFSPTGKYAALWRDRRNATTAANAPYRIYGSYSINGGTNFSSNFMLSKTDGALFIPIDGNDFLGCAISDTMVFGCWADKRSGSNQLYFNRYSLNNISTSIANNTKSLDIYIYPNPVDETINLDWNENINAPVSIVIKDISGKELMNKNFESAPKKIDTKFLISGNYFIEIYCNNNKVIKQFVKQSK